MGNLDTYCEVCLPVLSLHTDVSAEFFSSSFIFKAWLPGDLFCVCIAVGSAKDRGCSQFSQARKASTLYGESCVWPGKSILSSGHFQVCYCFYFHGHSCLLCAHIQTLFAVNVFVCYTLVSAMHVLSLWLTPGYVENFSSLSLPS